MKKLFISFFFLSFLFFLFPLPTYASLVTIDNEGEVILNVLSSQDEIALSTPQKQFEIKKIASLDSSSEDNFIFLNKDEEGVYLNVLGKNEKNLNVTNWGDDLIEIEERGDTQKMAISLSGDKFSLTQSGITALTDYPITINPKENTLSLETEKGLTYLAISPLEAVESALRSRYLTRVPKDGITINEVEGKLAYAIAGQKEIDLFRLVNLEIPVTAHVSALTGEILLVDQPTWLRVLGFLFV